MPTDQTPRNGRAGSLLRLIVRRGALRRFDRLKGGTADLPVTVEWDRRLGSHSDAPPVNRRKSPPFTWDAADFVAVDPSTEPDID